MVLGFYSGRLSRTQAGENVEEINQTLRMSWLQCHVPRLPQLLLQAMLSCSSQHQICCNSGTRADTALNKNHFFSKSAERVSKLATVLLPTGTTGDAVGVIEHAEVPLWAVQALWLHLQHQTKPFQFPSHKVKKCWGPLSPSKGNFSNSCPRYDVPVLPASSMFWQLKASM